MRWELFVVFLACLSHSYAKENFRVQWTTGTEDNAITNCWNAGKCNHDLGCCNGHGYCRWNGVSASCICDTPAVCQSGWSSAAYDSTKNCATITSTQFSDCCSGQYFNLNGGCHLDSGVYDPELGSKGVALKRLGTGTYQYSSGVASAFVWSSTETSVVTDLTSGSSTPLTSGNMMGLGFLELAQKDVVHYKMAASGQTPTGWEDGKRWPLLQKQAQTGRKIGSLTIPCHFENTATGVIDVGPLYDFAPRIVLNSLTTPYVDISAAITYWNQTHPMSFEFLTALRMYHAYHTYAARHLEEYFCGENNLVTHGSPKTCTIPSGSPWTSDSQDLMNWVFQQARRSTIRFSQSTLEQSVLQILLEHPSTLANKTGGTNYNSTIDGREHGTFEYHFRRDAYGSSSVRQHQEWRDGITRANLSYYLLSGIDWLISMRNPNYDTVAVDIIDNPDCSGIFPSGTIWPNTDGEGYDRAQLAKDVITLLHTPLRRFGSTIANAYKADLKLQLHRIGELGLDDYKTHLGWLTNQAVDLTGAPNNAHIYKGTTQETYSTRRYQNTIASVALASFAPINDAIWVDRAGFWKKTGSDWSAKDIHPDPAYFVVNNEHLLYEQTFSLAYQENSAYTAESLNANVALVPFYPSGFSPNKNEIDSFTGFDENPFAYRSHGFTFPQPGLVFGSTASSPWWDTRRKLQWKSVPEFTNVLFHQYDGFPSHAVKSTASVVRYLPNQFTDAIPTNIGWNDAVFDGFCFSSTYLTSCTRAATSFGSQNCDWAFTLNE